MRVACASVGPLREALGALGSGEAAAFRAKLQAMDKKSTEILDLPRVLDRLAAHTSFSASRQLAQELRPSSDWEEVQRRQAETREARHLLSLGEEISVGPARDIRPLVLRAAKGAILEPGELLAVQDTLRSARNLRQTFEDKGEACPTLMAVVQELEEAPDIAESIGDVLNEQGEVVDTASQALAGIRRELRRARGRLDEKLTRMLQDPKVAPMLQEALVTQRDGRYVLPLRTEFKGRLKGVIHDQSSSGATLFIEPLEAVDLNNRVRELELAERDEVRRILADLSRRIGEKKDALARTVEALAALDLAAAKARHAEELRAAEPLMRPFRPSTGGQHPGSTLRLLQARHPLLHPRNVVPIDLVLDPETYALVITGPNTGGKTVTLKTAGLLALMAACGLQISADSGSELSLFDAVYADIGDEQSIEQSLSTFSAHISNIIRILGQAGERSLVLLDELGAGTDPQEGAALARALLEAFLERRITTLVATHISALKAFAHTAPGVRNANMEFDLETLRPTYHLTIGLPGRSNALDIARRLGLEEEIVERARGWVSADEWEVDSLLEDIRREREQAAAVLREARQTQAHLQSLEQDLSRRLEALDQEQVELLEATREQALAEVESLRAEMERLRRKLKLAAQPLEALEAAAHDLQALEARIAKPRVPGAEQEKRPVRIGERVYLRSIGAEGVVKAVDEHQVEVQVGRLRVRAGLEELQAPGKAVSGKDASSGESARMPDGGGYRLSGSAPPMEVSLRGMTVDEALEALERHLDSAYLAGMPFLRIVHGKGTGRLREAVRRALAQSPYIEAFEPAMPSEGGEGVTIVRLSVD